MTKLKKGRKPSGFKPGGPDLSILTEVFSRYGINVRTPGDLLTSSLKSKDENGRIRAAWDEIRCIVGHPNP